MNLFYVLLVVMNCCKNDFVFLMVMILLFYNIQTHLKKWLEVAAISQKSGQSKANGQVIGQVRVVQIHVCHLTPILG